MAEPHSDIPPEDTSEDEEQSDDGQPEQPDQASSSNISSDAPKNYRSSKPVCTLNGKDYWVVEAIRDVQVDEKGNMLYLVKWQNWPDSDNSWEPEENCSYSRRVISEFHQSLSETKRNTLAQRILLQSMTRSSGSSSGHAKAASSSVRKPASQRKPYARKGNKTATKVTEKSVKGGKRTKGMKRLDESGSEGYHSTPSTPVSSSHD